MDRGFHTDDELVGMVCDRGPYAYLDLAQQHDVLAAQDVKAQRHVAVLLAHDVALDGALEHDVAELVERAEGACCKEQI